MAPLVSGAAALALSVTPTASLDEQRSALTTTATPLAAGLGAGRIDTDAAIAALAAGAPPAQDPDPSPSPAPIPTPGPEPEDPEDPEDEPPAPSFSDISDLVHRGAIEKLAESGISAGCRDIAYCPDRRVTRGQIATFLDRGLDLPDGDATFDDVSANHTHAAGIAAVARAGITTGCRPDRFCPNGSLTRGQMATLLQRALDLPDGGASFDDVAANHPHAAGIAAVTRADITKGCAASRFCPDAAVDRAQMASFLARALDL